MNREQDLIAENQDLNLQRWREGAMRLLLNQGLNPAAQLLTFLYRPHGAPTRKAVLYNRVQMWHSQCLYYCNNLQGWHSLEQKEASA